MSSTGILQLILPSDREIMLIRDFDAPRKLVFDAMSKPEMLKHWLLGPVGWSLVVCEVDLQVGGNYRYVWSNRDGDEIGTSGTYLEITSPERIVATEEFDQPWYPGIAVSTLELTEYRGTTTLTHTIRYKSKQARDTVLMTPLEQGLAAGYDRLATMPVG